MRACVEFDRSQNRIKQVWFSGDVFISPSRTLADLEAALRDTLAEQLALNVKLFFATRAVDMLTLTVDDFVSVLHEALAQAKSEAAA